MDPQLWFLRFNKDTGYRGGDAKNMKEEFAVYGLSETAMYAVGAAKVGLATTVLVGHAAPRVVRPASIGLAAFMLGAIVAQRDRRKPLTRCADRRRPRAGDPGHRCMGLS